MKNVLLDLARLLNHPVPTFQAGVAALVNIGKQEILADIAAGVVPSTVRSFADLHDYVDANTYAKLCDDEWSVGPTDDIFYKLANSVQDALHLWIVMGGLSVALAKQQEDRHG